MLWLLFPKADWSKWADIIGHQEPQTKNLPHQIPSKRFMPPHTNKFVITNDYHHSCQHDAAESCEYTNIEERSKRKLGRLIWNS